MVQFCRKKIMFIIPSLAGGGAEKVLVMILRYLDRERFEPVVVMFGVINDYKEDIPAGIRIISLNKRSRFDNLLLVPSLFSVIRDERPGLICSFLYYANFISVLARKISGLDIPLICTEHSILSEALKQARFLDLTRVLIKKLYPSADCVVSVSKGVKDDLVSNFGILEGRTFIIHNPVEFERVQLLGKEELKHPWFEEDIPVIVACGRLTVAKNYSLLLRAIALVSKSTPVRLVILGDGELRDELKSLAEKLGIQGNAMFLGFQVNPFKFMSQASVFVLSSSFEGFGNVIIEAMACGTPVVSTSCPSGPVEIISNLVNGILTPVDSEKEMADSILSVLSDRRLREKLITEGRKRAEEFDIKRTINVYEDLFESLTGGKRGGGFLHREERP